MSNTITMQPVRIVIQDDHGHDLQDILAYEGPARIRADRLPSGWHRYAWRDNGEDGDTLETAVTVNHIADYVSQEDITKLLDATGGVRFCFTDPRPEDHTITMPADIDAYA